MFEFIHLLTEGLYPSTTKLISSILPSASQLFKISHINGITVFFFVWLISFIVTSFRFIHVVGNGAVSSIFTAELRAHILHFIPAFVWQ